jgi:hypothetical protein
MGALSIAAGRRGLSRWPPLGASGFRSACGVAVGLRSVWFFARFLNRSCSGLGCLLLAGRSSAIGNGVGPVFLFGIGVSGGVGAPESPLYLCPPVYLAVRSPRLCISVTITPADGVPFC